MAPATTSTSCTAAPLSSLEVDLVVVPWFEGEPVGGFAELDQATNGELSRALAAGEFSARPFDLFLAPISQPDWRPRRAAFIGAGPAPTYSTSLSRQLATAAALAARQRRIEHLAFVVRPGVPDPSGDVDVAGFAQAITEGLTLAEFSGATYKTVEPPPAPPPTCLLSIPELPDTSPESFSRIDAAVARGRLLGECSNLARE